MIHITQAEYDSNKEYYDSLDAIIEITDSNKNGGDASNVKYGNTDVATTLDSINSSLIYSENETIVGTWVDGKPIYRKVIIDTTPSEIDIMKSYSIDISIDTIVNFYAIWEQKDSKGVVIHDGNTYYSNDYYSYFEYSKYDNAFKMKVHGNGYTNNKIVITFEYTKL